MKDHKKLIGGIAFLVLQAIVILVNEFPKLNSDSYEIGYFVGSLTPGVIGIILLVVYFSSKSKTK